MTKTRQPATHDPRTPFMVQLSDHYAFDFGGENNGAVAHFGNKGDAVAFAIELRRRTERAARVLDTSKQRSPEVFRANEQPPARDTWTQPTYTTPDITLTTGRVISHRRLPNGAQEATPTTGPREMTRAEWDEYCRLIVANAKSARERATAAA